MLLGALLLGAILIIAIIVLAVVFLTGDDPKNEPLVDEREPFSLDDVLRGRLQARRFNGTWIDGDSFHFFDFQVRI